ncbi:MAG: nuclear transport factor 2 family protein [Deltaproteobacteria bacterium]|nr:nuclear transport factor 2 family protein [Deltaproteobacteria bacterium]
MSAEVESVLAANAAFYEAFANRDVEAMDEVWARDASVACIHPGWRALTGRERVMESWRAILEGPMAPEVACSRERPYVFGEVAFVICVETLEDGEMIVTNVFAREMGHWKMVHHHAGQIAHPEDDEDDEPPPGLLN